MPSVLITGASRGIGHATARMMAARGWDVIAGVRTDADAARLTHAGGRIRTVVLDITNAEHLAALSDALPDRLDAVVNNAGIVVGGPVEAVGLHDLRHQLEVNVIGQIAVTQAVLPKIRSSRGRIIFVSSLSGRISGPMTGAYSASKFALEALADALRIELRPWRIPVVLVEPAQTDTDMWGTAVDLLEATVATLTDEQARLYRTHIDGQRKSIPKSQKMAAPSDGAASVIEKALTTARPKARYVVGTAPKVMGAVARLMPTPLRDAALASASGISKKA
jgi:NAD(P)-dependent dehydrogenase (short-subunit alcohol dehydrogenase family)